MHEMEEVRALDAKELCKLGIEKKLLLYFGAADQWLNPSIVVQYFKEPLCSSAVDSAYVVCVCVWGRGGVFSSYFLCVCVVCVRGGAC